MFCCDEVYLSYLFFQLFSHKSLYDDDAQLTTLTTTYSSRGENGGEKACGITSAEEDVEQQSSKEEDKRAPELSRATAIVLLIVVKAFIAITAEWFLDSINGLASSGGISKQFIGLILIPVVGNAAECAATMVASKKDKLTLSLGLAIGSSVVSGIVPLTRNVADVPLSSKWRCSASRSSSFLGGSSVGRSPCSSTRLSQSRSSCLS